eukprot:gene9871-10881_t
MDFLVLNLMTALLILIIFVCGAFSETSSAMHYVSYKHASIEQFPKANSPYANMLDHFKSVDFNENKTKILVSARNYVFQLDLETFSLTNTPNDRNSDCKNFFTLGLYLDHKRILTCASYAERGRCWEVDAINFTLIKQLTSEYGDKIPLSPRTPEGHSIALVAANNVVVAAVSAYSQTPQFSMQGVLTDGQLMSTSNSRPPFNNKILYSTNFISLYEGDDGFVYVFFTETAEEVSERKTVYSRVGRLCSYDQGSKLDADYVTFRKSQIVCYKKGNVPDYYDHIQSTTAVKVHNSNGTSEVYIYASFTTTVRSTGSSAICRYRLKDIQKLFATSKYYVNDCKTSARDECSYIKKDNPYPSRDLGRFKCDANLDTTQVTSCNWGCLNPLLYDDNEPFDKTAIMFFRGERITALALEDIHQDPSVNKTDVGKHVLFAGTDSGMIYKVAMNSTNVGEPVFLEKIQVVEKPGRITRLYFNKDYLIGFGPTLKLLKIKKERCESSYLLCSDCLQSRDPYCAWSLSQKKCTTAHNLPVSDRLQSIEDGRDSKCPPVDIHISCSLKIVDNIPGARTALLCAGHGIISPKIIAWKKGSALLTLNDMYQVEVVNASAQRLIIRDYSMADLGTYGCVVGVGRNKSVCTVTLTGTKPDVKCNTTESNCSCQASGYPYPIIRKVVNGNETVEVNHPGMFFLNPGVFVIALNAFGDDVYSCRINSKPATTTTSTTTLTTTTTKPTTTTTKIVTTMTNSTTPAATTKPSTKQTTKFESVTTILTTKRTTTTTEAGESSKPEPTRGTIGTPGKRVECPSPDPDKYFAAFVACLVLFLLTLIILLFALYLLILVRRNNSSDYGDEEDEFDGRTGTLNVSKRQDEALSSGAFSFFRRNKNGRGSTKPVGIDTRRFIEEHSSERKSEDDVFEEYSSEAKPVSSDTRLANGAG